LPTAKHNSAEIPSVVCCQRTGGLLRYSPGASAQLSAHCMKFNVPTPYCPLTLYCRLCCANGPSNYTRTCRRNGECIFTIL